MKRLIVNYPFFLKLLCPHSIFIFAIGKVTRGDDNHRFYCIDSRVAKFTKSQNPTWVLKHAEMDVGYLAISQQKFKINIQ